MNANQQLIEAAEHALAVFRSLAYRGYYPQELLPEDSCGKESPLFMGKQGLMFLINAVERAKKEQPKAWVEKLNASNGTTYITYVGTDERYMSIHEFESRADADFEAAEWNHLFGLGPEPQIEDFL